MKAQQITYDVSRSYLLDRSHTLPKEIFNRYFGAIRSRDYRSLATCFTDSMPDVASIEAAQTLLQLEAFFKKNASFTEPLEARLAALLSFEEGEELCAATNERLDTYLSERDLFDPDLRRRVRRAQQYIKKVLGPFRDFLELIPELVEVTGGATVSRPRRLSHPYLKLSRRIECTPGALPYLASLSEYFGFDSFRGKLFTWNRVEFVPKSWKTERTIACEPSGNMALQLAFDKYAKRRLKRFRINLSDQTRNQELAKEGSIHGSFATIDLSMASDTLAYNLVNLLLPEDWFGFLRAIRSQNYAMYPGQSESYHKFSSMGNGATFALETLVFAAACASVGSRAFSVYGDDIIIERDLAGCLLETLDFFGFVPNTNKSYSTGPFRESCGKSWYRGFDITPRYLRELDRRKAVQCHFINTMAEVAEPYGHLWKLLLRLTSDWKLPLVPINDNSMSGVWIHPYFAYSLKLIRKRDWILKFKGYMPKTIASRCYDYRSYILWHLGAYRMKERSFPYESSRYSIFSHKYVRKWVHWNPPVVGLSENNYLFSEDLILSLGSGDDQF